MPPKKSDTKKGAKPAKAQKSKPKTSEDDDWAALEEMQQLNIKEKEIIDKANSEYAQGIALMKQKKWTEAAEHFKASLAFAPEISKTEFQLGCAHFMSENHREAGIMLAHAYDHSTAKQTVPTQFQILLNLGGAFRMIPDGLPVAIQAFQKALKINPEDETVQKQLASCEMLWAEKDDIKIPIPEGAKGGDELTITVDGEEMKFILPPDAKPGGVIRMQKRTNDWGDEGKK